MPHDDTTPTNREHPFPDEDARQRAEQEASAILDRFIHARNVLHTAAREGSNAEVGEALRTVANLTAYLHRLIAVGWWHDRPF